MIPTPQGRPVTVAVSTSDSPDLVAMGLSEGHFREAMAEIALQLLAGGANLAYASDLRVHGFAKLLSRLVIRYTLTADLEHTVRVTNHLAWPVHIMMPHNRLEALEAELRGTARLVLLGSDGTRLTMDARRRLPTHQPTGREWCRGLTAMRKFQRSSTDARVILGGQVATYRGRIPGVAEEALLSLQAGQPLFLIGGFGGCTRDVAETLRLAGPWAGSRNRWPGRREFEEWTSSDLNNGLTFEENQALATTPFIGQAVVLVLRGVHRLGAEHPSR